MFALRQFVALLDTPGGHILVSTGLLVACLILHSHGNSMAKDLATLSAGWLGRSMIGANGKDTR